MLKLCGVTKSVILYQVSGLGIFDCVSALFTISGQFFLPTLSHICKQSSSVLQE